MKATKNPLTPLQIAEATLRASEVQPHFRRSGEQIVKLIERAVEADRAQRDPNEDGTVHGAAILALLARAENADESEGYDDSSNARRAAEWIESNPDDFWDTYVGPMLDDIERERGR